MADGEKIFAGDIEALVGQQQVDVGDPPGGGVLDGDYSQFGAALFHRLEHVLEGGAGQRFQVRPHIAAGLVRIGTRFPLEGDPPAICILALVRHSLHSPGKRLRTVAEEAGFVN
jgi:hypothetical protein